MTGARKPKNEETSRRRESIPAGDSPARGSSEREGEKGRWQQGELGGAAEDGGYGWRGESLGTGNRGPASGGGVQIWIGRTPIFSTKERLRQQALNPSGVTRRSLSVDG